MIRPATLVLLSCTTGAFAITMAALAQPSNAPAEQSVDNEMRTTVEKACSTCHQIDMVTSARKTRAGWSATLDTMIGYGAPIVGNREAMLDYLAANYAVEAASSGPPASAAPPAAATQAPVSPVQPRSIRPDAPDCCAPTAENSPKVSGNYGNQNYSSLAQINRGNIRRLGGAWHLGIEHGDDSAFQQSHVVAVDGVLYAESTQGSVLAVDGATGKIKWRYKRDHPAGLRRGVAIGDGKVFTTKGGKHVIALDQASGNVVWERDYSKEPTMGSLPTAITYYDGLIYLGLANSPRGIALALDAKTGEEFWRFYGTPGPGEYGHDSWAGDSWQRGGAAPWLHPALDPKLGLIYWTFGNAREGPSSALDGSRREGANLFANSIVAIDAKTGQRVWHFQSVHHDVWDMDNVMSPVLVDMKVGGRLRHAVIYGSKTAMLYILDRETGEPIFPIDEKPVPQSPEQRTWPTQPYTRNQPLVDLCPTRKGAGRVPPNYQSGCLFTPHLDEPVVHFPGTGGGADTSQYSYSHRTGLLYVGVGVVGVAQFKGHNVGVRPPGQERSGKIIAYDPAKGRIAWSKPMEWSLAHGNGVLSTAGDVLFIGQPDGYFLGLDARTGKELWRFQTGAGVHTQPVTYAINGEQYVAVLAGGNGLPYNSPKGDHLWAFKLDGSVPAGSAPVPPPKRQPVIGDVVDGAAVNNMIVLGRAWTNGRPGDEELKAINAVAPQILRVPVGTTVTFSNPADNKLTHCASQFFEGLFDKALQPGESFRYTFRKKGEYFFNDCAYPLATGKVIVE